MAEAATMIAETPWHLRELQEVARRQTSRFFYDDALNPEAAEFYERAYLSLRVQAFQREMEPFIRIAAKYLAAAQLQPLVLVDGELVERPRPAIPSELMACAAAVAARYGLPFNTPAAA